MARPWEGVSGIRRLTQEEFRFYKDNGYLVVQDLFTPQEAEEMLKTCERLAGQDYKAVLNPDRTVPELRQVMKDPRVVSALEELQGNEVVGLMSQIFYKQVRSPFASTAWNPHQDNAYPQAEDASYITINIFLQDTDPENGGMYVYPGSHRETILPFEPVPSYEAGKNPGNKITVPGAYQKVDLSIPQGGILFLHGHLIHGSHPNVSKDRNRTLYSCCYATKGKSFLPGRTAHRMVIPLR